MGMSINHLTLRLIIKISIINISNRIQKLIHPYMDTWNLTKVQRELSEKRKLFWRVMLEKVYIHVQKNKKASVHTSPCIQKLTQNGS